MKLPPQPEVPALGTPASKKHLSTDITSKLIKELDRVTLALGRADLVLHEVFSHWKILPDSEPSLGLSSNGFGATTSGASSLTT